MLIKAWNDLGINTGIGHNLKQKQHSLLHRKSTSLNQKNPKTSSASSGISTTADNTLINHHFWYRIIPTLLATVPGFPNPNQPTLH